MKVGITGHQQREGISWPWVKSCIDRYLAGKPQLFGYSSLAEGTDQIFADAVLSRGGKLMAVIPMDGYSAHFHGEPLRNFARLKSNAEIVELRSTKPDNGAFLEAGKWIVREVDRIIAVWDGEPAVGMGGTGDIVAYALSLGKPVHHIDPFKRLTIDL
ncbi:MAG: hypothetical protein V4475_00245 [Pseudomonadota bacterium]